MKTSSGVFSFVTFVSVVMSRRPALRVSVEWAYRS